jgi:hypothetical protein
MSLAKFLKSLFNQFVESYQQYFAKTLGYALLWTLVCFAIGQALAAYSLYDPHLTFQPISILSYFSFNVSQGNTYSFVDDFKIIFIFFVAIFSANLIKKVSFGAVLFLLITLMICAVIDYGLFYLSNVAGAATASTGNSYLYRWVLSILVLLRIFVPYLLFAITIQITTAKLRLSFKKLFYLFLSIWLFYTVSHELLQLLRDALFALILVPFKTKIYSYVMESLLGLPVLAAFFVGYYVAMTKPFEILQKEK